MASPRVTTLLGKNGQSAVVKRDLSRNLLIDDFDGDVRLVTHADDGISTYEAIGMCIHTTDLLRKALTDDDE